MQGRWTRRTIFAVAVLALSTAAFAGPFEIRRTVNDASAVRSEPVLATASFGPFDDETGVLGDGNMYFYVVNDAAGAPLQLSVHKNPGQNTVRLGFGDDDPASAPVDAAQSSVTVSPATIPANGFTVATVRVVPRDAAAVPLGAGLQLTVDVGMLLPGLPSGSIVDHGNGSYTLSVISWSEGFGDAVVTVEGVTLADEPQLTYEFADPAGLPADLIQLAAELEALADISSLTVAQQLDKIAQDLYKAVGELYETPPDFDQAIFRIAKAFEDLQKAVDDGMDPLLADEYRESLAEIARRIAVDAIDAAIVAGGDPDKIEDALANLDDGDLNFANQDFKGAVDAYMDAAKEAEIALT